MFLDTAYKPINPALFDETDWAHLVHGFNMQKTDTSVKYDVAFPVPLAKLQTPYTNQTGDRAKVDFRYSRVGFGGRTLYSDLGLDFAIYEPGDWEIVFVFKNDIPKTAND